MPEQNIIQRPELLLELSKRLGIRQAHVVSALNEGLQAVIILDDLTKKQSGERQLHRWTFPLSFAPVALANSWGGLYVRTTTELGEAGIHRKAEPIFIRRLTAGSIQSGGVAAGLVVCTSEVGKFLGVPANNPSLISSPWDKRVGLSPQMIENRSFNGVNGFSGGGTIHALVDIALNGFADVKFEGDTVVLPGHTFWVFSATDNFDLDFVLEFDMYESRET